MGAQKLTLNFFMFYDYSVCQFTETKALVLVHKMKNMHKSGQDFQLWDKDSNSQQSKLLFEKTLPHLWRAE